MTKQKTILVAPLNWGLGHATRCVPIIRELQIQKANVILGGDGMALEYLKKEFPVLPFIQIKDLEVRYPKSGGFLLYFAIRIPKLFAHVKKENLLLRKLVRENKIDGIISDNRYGMVHHSKPSVLITHQLFIETPVFKKTVHSIVKKLTCKFNSCWVPDTEGTENLSGRLSHQGDVNKNIKYIGLLSRFSAQSNLKNITRKVLVILSGPEPFRTQLEQLLIEKLTQTNWKALIVRGVISEVNEVQNINSELSTINYLTGSEIEQEIGKSEIVISRAGYSSIMDLVALHQKAILIPTPGQTEQDYLAEHLAKHPLFVCCNQKFFNLEEQVSKLQLKPIQMPSNTAFKKEIISEFLASC